MPQPYSRSSARLRAAAMTPAAIKWLLILKRFYPIIVVASIIAANAALSAALPIEALSRSTLLTDGEGVTLTRQAIAFCFGAFTQFWAGVLFDRTKPFKKFAAQVILAGLAASTVIGVLRDVAGISWQIGGESGVASVIGWLGVEVGFAVVQRILGGKGVQIGNPPSEGGDR